MKHLLASLLLVVLLASGCAAPKPAPEPVETLVTIRGVAPSEGNCEIRLMRIASEPYRTWPRPVQGPFEETFSLPPGDQEYVVEGECDSIISLMKSVTFPKDAPFEIGTIKP